MKFRIYAVLRISKYKKVLKKFNYHTENDAKYIEINSIEELKKLQKGVGYELIISFGNELYNEPRITIYDDYIEE